MFQDPSLGRSVSSNGSRDFGENVISEARQAGLNCYCGQEAALAMKPSGIG